MWIVATLFRGLDSAAVVDAADCERACTVAPFKSRQRITMSLAKHLSLAFCGLLVCATTAEVTYAQRGGAGGGGGRGGFGGQQTRTRFELATLPEVQAALKLNEEQKKLATDQLAKQREKRAALVPAGGGGGGAGFAAMQTEITKMNTELDAAFVAKLDDAQKSRMHGLIAQVNGATALLDPDVAKAIDVNEEQLGKLKSANDANRTARREAMAGFQDMSPEQRTEAMTKLTATESKSLMGLLTEAQVKKLETLKGAALTIDQTPLRPARRPQ